MRPWIGTLVGAIALSAAAICSTPGRAQAQISGTAATQPDPPATPLVSPSDKALLGGITPLSESSRDTLTIAPGTVPPLQSGTAGGRAPPASPPAR